MAGEGRIEELKGMLKARTDGKGKSLPGYAQNVKMIEAEIARLERDGDERALHG
jgi:hypothetical protein